VLRPTAGSATRPARVLRPTAGSATRPLAHVLRPAPGVGYPGAALATIRATQREFRVVEETMRSKRGTVHTASEEHEASATERESDPIASPPPGRARAIVGAGIALWLFGQLALPVSYYLGSTPAEERFAWRMFSTVSVFGGQCRLSVTETVAMPAAPGGRSTREVNLRQAVHPAWEVHLRRNRRIVIDKFLDSRCQLDSAVIEVGLRRSCARGPESGTPVEVQHVCRPGPQPGAPVSR
jgi:hypothetical protein